MLAKPFQIVVDPDHPINQGLIAWWTAPRAGLSLRNLVGPEVAATINSGVTRVDGVFGSAFKHDGGANGYIDLGSSNRYLASTTTPFTLMWMESVASGVSRAHGVYTLTPTGFANPFVVLRTTDTSIDNAHYGGLACGLATTSRLPSFLCPALADTKGAINTFILTGSGGIAGSLASFSLNMNGTTYVSQLGGGFANVSTALNYLGWDDGDTKWLGTLDNHRLWSRVLTSAQQSDLLADPYLGGRPMRRITRGFSRFGSLSGTYTENGSAIVGATIGLYARGSKQLISTTTTDASGNFSFAALLANGQDTYFVLMFDPDGGNNYNVGRHDRLTPGP